MEGFYLHNLSPFIVEFREGFGIRWYGAAYVAAFMLGGFLYRRLSEKKLNPIAPGEVSEFIQWAAIFGVLVGGRVGYILLYDFPTFLADPLMLFRVWQGGMASHGGILGLVFFTLYWAKKHRASWTGIGDSLVVVAPVGLFLVRMANFINGELYGRFTRVAWAVQFPTELRERPGILEGTSLESLDAETVIRMARTDGAVAEVLRGVLPSRHPSQVYEGLLEGALLFLILWLVRTRMRVPRGVLTGLFFILYAVFRIVGEQFRQPEDFNFGMPRGVFLSLFLIGIGVIFLVWGLRRRDYEEGFGVRNS